MAWHALFETGILALFLIFVYHSGRKKLVALLLFLCLNSFIFEELAYNMYHAVNYPGFHFYAADVPIAIIMGWAVALYSVIRLTDSFKVPEVWRRSVLDAVILLGLDFAIEPAAVRLGLWSWNLPGDFLGAPYDNFFAWLLYAFLVSFFVRRLWYADSSLRQLVKATVLIHSIGVPAGFVWFMYVGSFKPFLFWALVFSALALMLAKQLSGFTRLWQSGGK